MVRGFPLAGMVAVLIWTSSASAQPQDRREIQARKDCLTGKYESGVALLADLFAETGNSNFIYNQARCYEQNARPTDAINRFREYLRVAKDLGAADRADVETHIAECRKLEAEGRGEAETEAAASPRPVPPLLPSGSWPALPAAAAPSLPPVPVVPAAPPPASPQLGPGAAATTETSKPEQPAAARGAGLRVAGVVMGAGGLAAVATGAVFSILVVNTKQKIETEVNQQRFYDSGLDGRGKTYETLQWVSYGVGAALLAAGGIVYYVGYARGATGGAVSVGLVPRIMPGQAGLTLQGSY